MVPASDCVVIYSVLPEACVLATTETMTNAAWGAGATMADGAAPALIRRIVFRRVPSAADVSLGKLMYKVPFTPRSYTVQVLVTATGIAKAWVGGVTFDGTTGIVTVDNAGATDWAAMCLRVARQRVCAWCAKPCGMPIYLNSFRRMAM